jgi:hypothetical protein
VNAYKSDNRTDRFKKLKHEYTRSMLSKSESSQEERIANHYAAIAASGVELYKLVMLRELQPSNELNEVIKHIADKIREAHLEDFGIELDWHKEDFDEKDLQSTPH